MKAPRARLPAPHLPLGQGEEPGASRLQPRPGSVRQVGQPLNQLDHAGTGKDCGAANSDRDPKTKVAENAVVIVHSGQRAGPQRGFPNGFLLTRYQSSTQCYFAK
jgi:hypothetical protein